MPSSVDAQLCAPATRRRRTPTGPAIGTRVDVIRAYYGAVLAAEKVATLEIAVRAAREHVRQAESMAKNGMVTPSDALLASVKAGEVETLLLEAEGEASNARLGLATLLGAPADNTWALADGPPDERCAAMHWHGPRLRRATSRDTRADVDAARAGADGRTRPMRGAPDRSTCRGSTVSLATTGTRRCVRLAATTTGRSV